jgi:hypothetical protein
MGQERVLRNASHSQLREARQPNKQELERQMQRNRESLAETIGEIKETVEQEYTAAKQTVSGVLDFREQFKDEPLVWSLGALSAGFAFGYTVGYAQKHAHRGKGGKHSQLFALADSMVDELSSLGQGLVMPVINLKIKELFGFDFSELLKEMGQEPPKTRRKTPTKLKAVKPVSKKRVRQKQR